MNILFLSRWFPYPTNNGSKLRIYNLLRGLSQYHEITLLSFADQPGIDPHMPEIQLLCQEVHVIPWQPFNPNSHRARLGFFSLTPRSAIDTFSLEMKQCIERALTAKRYDMVIASQVDMAIYSQYFKHLPAMFEEVEVGALYEKYAQATSVWRRFRDGITWAKHQRYLRFLLENFQVCTVVSNQERQLLCQVVNGSRSIEVIPNCVNLASYNDVQEVPQPNRLIFTGSFSFYPNYEAMVWFVQKAYPLIKEQAPDVQLSITGNHADRPLPSTDNITLTGFVDDVRPLIARSWVSVVPIHTGGGTRLKILEAMALRTPVVSTSKGAEGLDVQPGKHILIADTPETFAQAVVRLLKDRDLRQQIADNGYNLVNEKYNWTVVLPCFLHLIDQVAKA